MGLEPGDLFLQPQSMSLVLLRVDRFLLERGMLLPQNIDLVSKAIVLGVDVFPFAHM